MRCPAIKELPPAPSGMTGWPWIEESPRLPDALPHGNLWPRISIVTPSHDKADFIEETIRSVLLQAYPDIEYIIIDGASRDGTVDIIRKYEQWLAFWVSEEDRGQSHAVNKGIDKASGEILFWLNADDLCLPGAFRIVAETFADPSCPNLVVGSAMTVDERSRVIDSWRPSFTSWEDYALRRCTIRQVSAFFRRALFEEMGGLDERLHYSMDRDLLLRFTRRYQPMIIEEFVTAYRKYHKAKSQRSKLEGIAESYTMSLDHVKGTPWMASFLNERARNWLSVAIQRPLPLKDRLACLVKAVRLRPRLLVNRVLWHRLRDILYLSLGKKNARTYSL